MARKRRKPQPPIARWARPSESRPLWLGLPLTLIGIALIVAGALVLRVVTGQGDVVQPSWRLIKSATVGGLERARQRPQQQPQTRIAAGTSTRPATRPGELPPGVEPDVEATKEEDFCYT